MNLKILITDLLHPDVYNDYKDLLNITYIPDISPGELKKQVINYDILVISTRIPITKEILENASSLRLIIRMGAGVDHIDLSACAEKNIIVCNTPSSVVASVTEYVFGQLIRLFKDFESMNESVLNGSFRKGIIQGKELYSKTIGIIGVGRIGSRIAGIAKCFGMTTLGNDPYIPEINKNEIKIDRWVSKTEITRMSDIITLHVPLTDETKYMINDDFIKNMKDNSILINTSRGKVVKYDDVIKYAENKKFNKIILDVFEKEPFKPGLDKETLKYFYFSPHAAAYTKESMFSRSKEAMEEINEFSSGNIPHGVIDFKIGY